MAEFLCLANSRKRPRNRRGLRLALARLFANPAPG